MYSLYDCLFSSFISLHLFIAVNSCRINQLKKFLARKRAPNATDATATDDVTAPAATSTKSQAEEADELVKDENGGGIEGVDDDEISSHQKQPSWD